MSTSANDVHEVLGRAMLVEGYPMVLDLERSYGSWLFDAKGEREYLDFFTFYASRPIGYNHPKLRDPQYLQDVLLAGRVKPSNCDFYTSLYADFVEAFRTQALGAGMKHLFFIPGGALAVENALKAAFDWKTRKNMAGGRETPELRVIHFKNAFHGRSGYTLSLTNTSDPAKTQYFPKFDWPRVDPPVARFPLEGDNLAATEAAEKATLAQIDEAYETHGQDAIAAIIIEPVQCEGGDNHFRPEFLRALRAVCDDRETILIFDEVQTGMGASGSMWMYEHLDVRPDIVAFAKKAQTGGVMASERFDEVDSVFSVKSRISSTFGGNLVDFVRCKQILSVIQEEGLLSKIAEEGRYIMDRLGKLVADHEGVTNARGVGALAAFDLPDGEKREAVIHGAREEGLLVFGCGASSVRLRPALDLSHEDATRGMDILHKVVTATLA